MLKKELTVEKAKTVLYTWMTDKVVLCLLAFKFFSSTECKKYTPKK